MSGIFCCKRLERSWAVVLSRSTAQIGRPDWTSEFSILTIQLILRVYFIGIANIAILNKIPNDRQSLRHWFTKINCLTYFRYISLVCMTLADVILSITFIFLFACLQIGIFMFIIIYILTFPRRQLYKPYDPFL